MIIVHDSEVIARTRGIATQTQLFCEFFYSLVLVENLLHNSDNLYRTLQKTNYSASEDQLIAQKRKKKDTMSVQNYESFNNFNPM